MALVDSFSRFAFCFIRCCSCFLRFTFHALRSCFGYSIDRSTFLRESARGRGGLMHRISHRHNITSFYSSRMGVHFFFCFTLCSQLTDDASNLSAWHPESSTQSMGRTRGAGLHVWVGTVPRRLIAMIKFVRAQRESCRRLNNNTHPSVSLFFLPFLLCCLDVERDPGPSLHCTQWGCSVLNDARRR